MFDGTANSISAILTQLPCFEGLDLAFDGASFVGRKHRAERGDLVRTPAQAISEKTYYFPVAAPGATSIR